MSTNEIFTLIVAVLGLVTAAFSAFVAWKNHKSSKDFQDFQKKLSKTEIGKDYRRAMISLMRCISDKQCSVALVLTTNDSSREIRLRSLRDDAEMNKIIADIHDGVLTIQSFDGKEYIRFHQELNAFIDVQQNAIIKICSYVHEDTGFKKIMNDQLQINGSTTDKECIERVNNYNQTLLQYVNPTSNGKNVPLNPTDVITGLISYFGQVVHRNDIVNVLKEYQNVQNEFFDNNLLFPKS